jgi:phosphomannomutase/phosphoglucomutase
LKINPHIFRGYDLRGIVGKDLNTEIAEHLGKAYGTYLIKHRIDSKTVVGYDSRLTSSEYKDALIKGIASTGIHSIDIGLTMTGTFYWSQYFFKSKGGVMVTASHNPAEYNGFKFATGLSETMVSEEIQELRQIAEEDDFVSSPKKGIIKKQDIKLDYYNDLLRRFDIKKKFKIVVDASNATPGVIVPELLRKLGCEVIESNCNLDSSFPLGTPDPTEKAVAERLAKKVLSAKADIGLTFDADGDRIGVVDHKGNILWNDILVALFAADVLRKNNGAKIVFNTLCSKAVQETIMNNHGIPVMWRTGHSFIKAKAREENAKFAGELSGHFFFLDRFYGHDDGAYAALRLLEYLSQTDQTLFDAAGKLPHYISSPEIKVGCSDDKKLLLMKKIARFLRSDFPSAEIIDDERAGDGVRLDLEGAMLVIRYSQNGPYMTIKFEAKKKNRYDELKEYIHTLLHKFDEVDWNYGVNVESLESA